MQDCSKVSSKQQRQIGLTAWLKPTRLNSTKTETYTRYKPIGAPSVATGGDSCIPM